MIYQVKDNKKIPLGTQFDNSWEIEYDRDLSSQLNGKTEWTATEDCWFQHQTRWNNTAPNVPYYAYLNGVNVSVVSTFSTDSYLQITNILLKKGDNITLRNSSGGTFPFIGTNSEHITPDDPKNQKLRVFPIHRILSKDEGPVEVTLTVTHNNVDLFTTTSRSPSVTLYPIGNDVYIFATPVSGINFTTVSSGGTGNATFNVSIDGFDMLDLKMDYWQNATGVPSVSGTSSANINPDKYILVVQNIQKNGQYVFMRGQGIVRRKS